MSYDELVGRIYDLQNYGLEIFSAGQSVLGKEMLATHVGSYSGTQILIQAAIHAREYITTLLLIELARYWQESGLIQDGGIYFIFISNPDGVKIVLDGIEAGVPCEVTRQFLILANNGSTDFSTFKANVNSVDLNTNFSADWGQGALNVTCPSAENFIGFFPDSEREVRNLIDFTLKNRPALTISYHSKGEIIYYGFQGESEENLSRDREIGTRLAEETGYRLVLTENSTGGYKDWCIQTLKIPAYTFEVGAESLTHPITEEYLPEIVEQNLNVPTLALSLAIEYQSAIQLSILNKIIGKGTKNGLHARSTVTSAKSKTERGSSCGRSNSMWRKNNFKRT